MEQIRKPFQGVWNIIRFNRHFYVVALIVIVMLPVLNNYIPANYRIYLLIPVALATITMFISLVVSWYIYDASGLYTLHWLSNAKAPINILNVHAGFDETSVLLKDRFPDATLEVLDFYNPLQHTEISIRRARKAYPPYPGTKHTTTSSLNLPDASADMIMVMLAAHEIRDPNERDIFFRELYRILKPKGQIIVTEHLRDTANFLAYNIGFVHFLSKSSWYQTFKNAHLHITSEQKTTPFITTFTLDKNGTAS